jgi:hypothetical protein
VLKTPENIPQLHNGIDQVQASGPGLENQEDTFNKYVGVEASQSAEAKALEEAYQVLTDGAGAEGNLLLNKKQYSKEYDALMTDITQWAEEEQARRQEGALPDTPDSANIWDALGQNTILPPPSWEVSPWDMPLLDIFDNVQDPVEDLPDISLPDLEYPVVDMAEGCVPDTAQSAGRTTRSGGAKRKSTLGE